MNSFDSFFADKLSKRISEDMDSNAAAVLNGTLSHDLYQQRVGRHRAMGDVLAFMAEVRSELLSPDTSQRRSLS